MKKKTELVETEIICKYCPMRRDSYCSKEDLPEDIALWYSRYFWPNYKLLFCWKNTDKICLGALVHIRNLYATIMLQPELQKLAKQYEEDHKLIFSSNNEFIRYHRGEDFGSLAWYKRSTAYIYGEERKAVEEENDDKQGKLF